MGDLGTLVIVGASVRAAAMSAVRAGYRPIGIDLFADRDLRRIAECQRIEMSDYPEVLGERLRTAPPGPWMYTGGLENHPELIEEWRQVRELIGNGKEVLCKIRDPHWLSRHVPFAEIAEVSPHVSREWPRAKDACAPLKSSVTYSPGLPPKRFWLRKPRRGAGGIGIEQWDGQRLAPDTFLQQFISGKSVSAVFVGSEAGCQLIGSTRQLVGESWLHAQSFRYCGSIGPRVLTNDERRSWVAIGETLTFAGGLRGVFGVDAIVNDSGLTVTEVNPRYPASAELLELTTGQLVITGGKHQPLPRRSIVGKGIYFAPRAFRLPYVGPWDAEFKNEWDPWRIPLFGDVPAEGEAFRINDPVVTFFAAELDEEACLFSLRRQAQLLDQHVANCDGGNPAHVG